MDLMDALQDFVRAFVPRQVVIPNLDTFYVQPATVEQALTIYALLPDYAEKRVDEILRRVAGEWLPDRLAAALWREPSWQRRADLLVWLLRSGIKKETPEPEKADSDEIYTWVREKDWYQLVAEYRAVYKCTTRQVLDEAWPLFLKFSALMDRVRRIEQVSNVEWFAAANTGKADSIFVGAGFIKKLQYVQPAYMNDEWFERQMKAARKESKSLWGDQRGEA